MSCVCPGLGVSVDGTGSAYELVACADHPLPTNPQECIETDDAAAMRVDECLRALASVRDLLCPEGSPEASWSPDTA